MNNTSITLLSVVALALLTACGGGGSGGAPVEAQVAAAAAAAQTGAGGAATAPSADKTTADVLSPAGTFQKGSGPLARPALDPSLVTRVHAELDLIDQVLRRADDGEVETQEALAVVSDARAELKKERPNKLRLRSLLAGLASNVQVVDGMNSPSVALARLVPLI